ncbi:MAG: apolipoprotein N-acyltransferase [Ilumatobacteraceae bacterium]
MIRRIAGSTRKSGVTPIRLAKVLIAGLLVAFSLPPWGWWPCAFFGVAIFAATGNRVERPASRFLLGTTFAVGWLAPGMAWMWFLTAPGYVGAVLLYASFHGLATVIYTFTTRRTVIGPLLHTLAEALRFSFPLGGVPLASVAIGQADSPLATLARLGGSLFLTWIVFHIGFQFGRGAFRNKIGALALTACLVIVATLSSNGSDRGVTTRIAAVQGGGPQGTLGVNTNFRDVFERHLTATQSIASSDIVDMVIWPENVIDVTKFSESIELKEITSEAQRLNAPFVVGITEDVNSKFFTNAQVVVNSSGTVTDRYDKVRRVPFGEYMPLRGLFKSLGAPVDLVPRDALAGSGVGILDVDGVQIGVVISWEVFFAGRVREGIRHGGQLIINPTNGASFTGTILQTQQIAVSRLRAIESGRWLLQVSPTGFSGVISPDGALFKRTGIGEQHVLYFDVPLRKGSTLYSELGDRPLIVAMLVVTIALLVFDRRRKRAIAITG